MKQKLLSILALLLMTAATGAWAQDPDYDINVHFDHLYNPMQTHFDCMIMNPMYPGAEIKGTLDLSVDGDLKGSFDVDGGMVFGSIPALDAGDHTWSVVFNPEGGSSVNKNGNFTIDKAYTSIIYYGSTSINLGVGESTELEVYFSENEAGELSYSSSNASVASITKNGYNTYIIQAEAAGTATITFSYAGSTNYDAAEDKTITVTVWPAIDVTANEGASSEFWATFYSNGMNYQAPSGTQVFKVALAGSAITMTEITDRIVKSGQGVVLKKTTSGSITMTPTSSNSSDDYSGNSLVGTATAITNPGDAYVLSKKNGVVGFYKLSTSGTIGANKAYLIYDGTGAREFFPIEGNVTGIEMPKAATTNSDAEVYDLQGRQVANPTKGLYIVNGKKVFINK
ncbi:MAG: hypothetical protein J6I37_02770 [Prevotella sp.]|nr:hypothetical protein [Prevotella sp.]